jgi:uncharacterized protein (TIGR03437 family)
MLLKLFKSAGRVVSLCYTAALFGQPVPTLQLRVSSEQVTAGGMAQVKVFLATPAAIASGNLAFQLDQNVFGDVAAATVFSAMGDAYGGVGTLNVTPGYFTVAFTSPSGGVGRLPGLPIFEFTVPVKSGSATVTPVISVSSLKDLLGRSYGLTVVPGTVTVSGSLAVQIVTPGGGIVPAGSVVSVRGVGFTPATSVAIDQVRIASVNFVNAQQIDVTLGAATEMTGKHVLVTNPDRTQVDYWAWLHNLPEGLGRYAGQHPILGLATMSSAMWSLSSQATVPGHAYGLALQNPNPAPVDATVTNALMLSGFQSTGVGTVTQTIPAWGSCFVEIVSPPNSTLQTTPSTPIRVLGLDLGGNPITFSKAYPINGLNPSQPVVGSIVNAASNAQTALSPGEIISIYGAGLGAPVSFDGVAAPLLYVSSSQINAAVPYSVSGKDVTMIKVQNGATWGVPIAPSVPGIFTLDASGAGRGAVLNQDSTVNDVSHPAARGSVIQIYATGEGDTSPPGVTGSVTHGDLKKPLLPVTVTIGKFDAAVQYAGSAPEAVAGLFQVNAVVPQGVTAGPAVPITVTVGSARSQDGVTIAVQ